MAGRGVVRLARAVERGGVVALRAVAAELAALHDAATEPSECLATARALLATLVALDRAERLAHAPGPKSASAAATAGGSAPVDDPVAELRIARQQAAHRG
jgi:hypothetical protein